MPEQIQKQAKTNETVAVPATEGPAGGIALDHASAVLQRAQVDIRRLTPSDVMALQRSVGNQATARLLGKQRSQANLPVVQTKLAVGPANDRFEREADEVANRVLRMPTPRPNEQESAEIQRTPIINRAQRRAPMGLEGGQVDADLERNIKGAQSGGSPLPANVRSHLEPTLGADLTGVKVHTGSRAVQLNRDLGAKAFTHRNHIFYGAGQSPSDLKLTAHEAVHTVQQGGVKPIQRHPAQEKVTQAAPQRIVNRDSVVQRFAYNDDPATWAPVSRIKRSGEGVEGVYFVFKNSTMLVVKPVTDPGNIEYANQMTAAITGLDIPETVSHSLTGTDPITQLLTSTKIEGARNDEELTDKLKSNRYWLVMSTVSGKSIQTLSEDSSNNEALDFITNQSALQDTGRIMVADSFLGNSDRLIGARVNLGNFFYNSTSMRAATIDNDMDVKAGEFKRDGSFNMPAAMEAFEWFMDGSNRTMLINQFIAKFKQSHPALIPSMNEDQIRTWVSRGIDLGLANLQRTLQDINQVRSVKDIDAKYGQSKKRDYGMLKGRAQYMSARVGGMAQDKAQEKMGKYIKYKEMYNKLPKGLKWTARIWNKGRGF